MVLEMNERHTFRQIVERVSAALRQGCNELVLDFQKVRYMPSSTIGVILALDNRLRLDGVTLQVKNVGSDVFDELKLFGLENLIIGGVSAYTQK
jgi:anti-anti-sigma factor